MRNRSYFWIFLTLGIVVQCVTYYFMPDSPWSLVSGLLGICSVVLGAQGNILTFIFGFAQVGTYTYLCIQERFYAEIALNAYYFITMIYGIYIWKKRLHADSLEIQTRSMPGRWLGLLMLLMVVMSVGVGWCLQRFTDDPQPYLDAWTTIPALVAQILMVLAFREQWYIWLLVDLLAFVMWLRAGDYCMAAQYLFWCANCVYGYVQWSKDNRLTDLNQSKDKTP